MRIGLMLRALEEKGGIGVYTQNLVKELLAIDDNNQYYLYYRTPDLIGTFDDAGNVTERLVRAPNKILWDQVGIPIACRRDRVDVILHPKFTVPIFAPCKKVMVVHGADWFFEDQAKYYNQWNVCFMRIVMPLYLKRSDAVLSVSQLTTDQFNQVVPLTPEKIKTVYFGPAKNFRPEKDELTLQSVRKRYHLPDNFILGLTKPLGDSRKNLVQVLNAYALYHQRVREPHKLVIVGKDAYKSRARYRLPDDSYGRDIHFPGWIDQADMPAVYALADVFLYPSNLEAFPIPVTEAMACGTPVITSDTNGLKEIAGDAAYFVDPTDTEAITSAIVKVLGDHNLRKLSSKRGLERSKKFSWDKCARETLEILEALGD